MVAAPLIWHRCRYTRAVHPLKQTRFPVKKNPATFHLYNLRRARGYQARRRHWTKTRGRSIPIGQRRAPTPDGRAGFIRIDSVHQGDQDGVKGVYHINAVDCVTQWQRVASCEQLSEAYLLPVLQRLFESFPFVILGFHADNGSEYINHTVAKLLEKLRVEFYPSRARATATTMRWLKPRTRLWCASTWVMPISRSTSLPGSMTS